MGKRSLDLMISVYGLFLQQRAVRKHKKNLNREAILSDFWQHFIN